MKKREYYKDILTYIEARLQLADAIIEVQTAKDFYKQQLYREIIRQRQEEIDKWLEEEIGE